MCDLLHEEAIALVGSCILIRLSKQRIERFGDPANGRGIFAGSKGGHIYQSLGGVDPICCTIEKIGVFHVFGHTLEQ